MNNDMFSNWVREMFAAFLHGKEDINWATRAAKSETLNNDDLRQILAKLEPEYGKTKHWSELIAKLRELGHEI